MSMQSTAALPFYFGPGDALFGSYHASAGGNVAGMAVLLCPPLGQELIRAHRVYRQIADALAATGIPALRFDYYGTGDSAGESFEVDWHRCIADTVAAAAQLRARSGCRHVVGFGARLGATAALACGGADFSQVLAWDPVVDTHAQVDRFDALQVALGLDTKRFAVARSAHDTAGQWLGFPFAAQWRRQLRELRLQPPTVPVHLFDSLPAGAPRDWHVLGPACCRVTPIEPPTFWDDLQRLEHAILSPGLVRAICRRVQGLA